MFYYSFVLLFNINQSKVLYALMREGSRLTSIVDMNSGLIAKLLKNKNLFSLFDYNKSNENRYQITGNKNGTSKLQNNEYQEIYLKQTGHTAPESSLKLSLNSKYALTTSHSDHNAHLWDVQSGIRVRTLSGHLRPITSVNFSPDSQQCLTSSQDGTVKMQSLPDGDLSLEINLKHITNQSVFSPYGMYILTASNDNTARMWNRSGINVLTLVGHKLPVSQVLMDDKEEYIYTASYDNSIKRWDSKTGQMLHTFMGHFAPVLVLSLSTCGNFLLSTSKDMILNVWDLNDDKIIQTLKIPKINQNNPKNSGIMNKQSQINDQIYKNKLDLFYSQDQEVNGVKDIYENNIYNQENQMSEQEDDIGIKYLHLKDYFVDEFFHNRISNRIL